MSIKITGNTIPGYFLSRPREAYLARFERKAAVVELPSRVAIEALRLRAVA